MKERKYEELETLMPDAGGVGMIPKTMIFVDNIDEAIAIPVYLRKRLPARICASKARTVVRSMSKTKGESQRDQTRSQLNPTNVVVVMKLAIDMILAGMLKPDEIMLLTF